jgi:hypothetical protein
MAGNDRQNIDLRSSPQSLVPSYRNLVQTVLAGFIFYNFEFIKDV